MVFLVLILFVSEVNALGISPARKIVDFEPGLEDEIELKIINTGNEETKLVIYVEGEMADLVELEDYELNFLPGEESKTIKYKFKLPEEIDTPGDHDIEIVVREVPLGEVISDTMIGSSVAVVHQLKIKVPYPGKYAIADLKVIETGRTDQVNFVVVVHNLGLEKIENANARIDVFNANSKNKITELRTELFSIDVGEDLEIPSIWNKDVEFGEYYAKLIVTYDGKVTEAVRELSVGERLVNILSIYTKGFKLGEIAKFNILLENLFPEKIYDTYTTFLISDKGVELADFKSVTEDIEGYSKKELTAYWDTEGIDIGEYDVKIGLHYEGGHIELDMKTKVLKDNIIFEGLTGAVISDSPGGNKNFFIGAIVIFVLTSLFWVYYFKFRKKK